VQLCACHALTNVRLSPIFPTLGDKIYYWRYKRTKEEDMTRTVMLPGIIAVVHATEWNGITVREKEKLQTQRGSPKNKVPNIYILHRFKA